MIKNWGFQEVWLIDFEFSAPPGEPPKVVCLVAREIKSHRKIRLWADELYGVPFPPYAIDQGSLIVAYYASAEMGCHLALGWPIPHNILDLFTEFRNVSNGLNPACGNGLLGALAWHGLRSIDAIEKDSMRELAIRGGPWTENEQKLLLDYCESDVSALDRLLTKMAPHIDISRALLRGRYMKAAACIEHNGIPIDIDTVEKLQSNWGRLQDQLIAEIDSYFGVYDGRTFKEAWFSKWLVSNNIAWPRLPSGKLDLKDDTFKEMSRIHLQLLPLRELRLSLSQMRLSSLAIGTDGRNRCLLSAFRSRTGRNQPSNSSFIFGPSVIGHSKNLVLRLRFLKILTCKKHIYHAILILPSQNKQVRSH
jgi:DNA polymerase I